MSARNFEVWKDTLQTCRTWGCPLVVCVKIPYHAMWIFLSCLVDCSLHWSLFLLGSASWIFTALYATPLKYIVTRTKDASFQLSTATSRWLAVKWHHFRVTSGHLRSRDVIFCHVSASSFEPLPCRKWNAQYTRVFNLLQPLPDDCRSNDVTSGSLLVTWGHVTSFPVT